ncbi:hypothetical protein [Sphingobacterium sp.]|uniref:hypothetical protein n=1 Tax=Sphingobacterium sp. TaxID=341027 RepID=UPI0031E01146
MSMPNLEAATYYVSGLAGFNLTEALRFWKTKFETIKHFKRDVITHPYLKDLDDFVSEMWDSIDPITVQQALAEKNTERRRVMFDCIGVAKLFSQLEPELLNKQVLSKTRTRWDQDNKPWKHQFEDVYELYRIEGKKLFEPVSQWQKPNDVFAVRCWCTTTNREYWIYVPEDIATGIPRWRGGESNPDAIRAIAWTIRIDITNPKRIFRQGDIIVAEESDNSSPVEPYHLSKEQYIHLLFSET